MEVQFQEVMKPLGGALCKTSLYRETKTIHSKDQEKASALVFLLLIIAIIVHGTRYGDSYFETQRTNTKECLRQPRTTFGQMT